MQHHGNNDIDTITTLHSVFNVKKSQKKPYKTEWIFLVILKFPFYLILLMLGNI